MTKKKRTPAPVPTTRIGRWLRDLADALRALGEAVDALGLLLVKTIGFLTVVATFTRAFLDLTA